MPPFTTVRCALAYPWGVKASRLRFWLNENRPYRSVPVNNVGFLLDFLSMVIMLFNGACPGTVAKELICRKGTGTLVRASASRHQ